MQHSPIRLIVGLGNPGPTYTNTRHNAGFWFVDQLAQRHHQTFRSESKFHALLCRIHCREGECWLLKPETFMNRSGLAVAALLNYYQLTPAELLVAHDELDFVPGQVRFKQGGGHGGHNGLRDILAHLTTPAFQRLRIGIGHPGERTQVVNYVLNPPDQAAQRAIEQGIERACDCLPELLRGDWQRAQQALARSV